MTHFNETDTQVMETLSQFGIVFRTHIAATNLLDNDWRHDLHIVTLINAKNGAAESFKYRTGIGHRVTVKGSREIARRAKALGIDAQTYWVPVGEPKPGRSLPHYAHGDQCRAPIASPAGVMHSLVLDSQAAGMTFNEWCDDYGYNNDSIKDRATYDACQVVADKLRHVFTGPQLAELTNLVADY